MTVEFCKALFIISKNLQVIIPVRSAALIHLIRALKCTWLTAMSNEVKTVYLNNYFEMIYGDWKNYEKLFFFFSDLIVDAVLLQNEYETVFSHLLFTTNQLLGSLIIAKSISKHFKRHVERDENILEQFSSHFCSSISPFIFTPNISFEVIDLTYSTIYNLMYRKIPLFFIEHPTFVANLIIKYMFFSENLNCFEQETYQKCIKTVLKTIQRVLLFLKKKKIINNFFPINENNLLLIFNFSQKLFTMNISPPVRDSLTRFLVLIFNTFTSVLHSINNNLSQFIESTFLPFFFGDENSGQLYTEIAFLYEPRDSAIFLLQSLTSTINQEFNQRFIFFLNQYLVDSIRDFFQNCGNISSTSKILLSKTNMISSSMCLNDVSLFQAHLFQSDVEDVRISAFTILVNFQKQENVFFPHEILFNECFSHFNDKSFVVRRLAAISVLRSIENIEKLQNYEHSNCLPQMFAAYLSISQDPQSPKLLKKLLEISGNPGYEISNMLLSSLVSNLMYIFSDPSGMITSKDGSLAQKIGKRICDIIMLRKFDEAENFSCDCRNFDDFVLELLSLYQNFDDFFKEVILKVFETSVEICCISPNVSWQIVKIFCFRVELFEDEAKILKNILILSRNQNIFEFELAQFLLEQLFVKLVESDEEEDVEIALSLIGNFISSLINHGNIQASIVQRLLPILGQKITNGTSSIVVSQLISICLLFSNQENIGIIFQEEFISFWLENGCYPYFCSSAIFIFPNILNFDMNITSLILLKACDDLADFAKDGITNTLDFPEFEIENIVSNLLKLLKFLKENHQQFYIEFYVKACGFLDETLPQIVDDICE